MRRTMVVRLEWREQDACLAGLPGEPWTLRPEVHVVDKDGAPRVLAVSHGGFPGGTLTLAGHPRDGGWQLDGELVNQGDSVLRLGEVRLELVSPTFLSALPETRVFLQGFQSWTPTRAVAADTPARWPRLETLSRFTHDVDAPFYRRRDGLSSHGVLVLAPPQGEALLLGHLTHHAALSWFFLQQEGPRRVLVTLDYGGKEVAPGAAVTLERLWLASGVAGDLLERWATLTGTEMGARRDGPVPAGWCSWYEHDTGVREQDVLANADALARHPELGVRLVQLDDGYQGALGDWLTCNSKFPRGLQPLVQDVCRRGLTAGVWTAPFLVERTANLFTQHPEWLLRDRGGDPVGCGFNPAWGTQPWALDASNPAVRAWLASTFRALRQQGFTVFKVDFLFAGVRHGVRQDASRSPVEAYRAGLAAIREGIGPDAFLLGCGAPLGPSVGLVDGMRVSQDVKEEWDQAVLRVAGADSGYPSAKGAVRNVLTRAFLHRRWWRNDPDCLLVRDRDTHLTPTETETLLTVLGMSGGLLFLGDDLPRLARERLEWAARVLPPTLLSARVPAPLARDRPEEFLLQGARRQLWALINHDDQRRRRPFSAPDATCFDFWRARVVEEPDLELPPHGVRALLCTPRAPVPQLVGTDVNLVALVDGRVEDVFEEDRQVLRVRARDVARAVGRLWLRVPEGWSLRPLELPRGVKDLGPWSGGRILRVDVPLPWDLPLPLDRTRTP